MTDIVEKLRQGLQSSGREDEALMFDAAAEIERLRAENARQIELRNHQCRLKLKAIDRAEELKKALEPFAAANETASKVADIHGENEFVLSFGPVPVGVIPLSAFINAREKYTP